jgi:hypothetical protein
MAAPPVLEGAVKLTVAVPLAVVALPIVGVPGAVAGVMLLEALEAAPVPAAFVAVTVKVYGVPFASPVTVTGLLAPNAVCPPGLATTV